MKGSLLKVWTTSMQTNNTSRKCSVIQAKSGKYRLVSNEMSILAIRRLTLTRNTSSLQIYFCLRIWCKSNDFFPDTEKGCQRGSPRRPKRTAKPVQVAGRVEGIDSRSIFPSSLSLAGVMSLNFSQNSPTGNHSWQTL